ncbi:MAG: CPBP family intramembrane metalloprotease [Planctomycetes bacterium]|nr:CPBP family intramembrane metalloprotease [Planctomycetota bacterium]
MTAIDWATFAAAMVLLGAAFFGHLHYSGSNILRGAPERPNRFHEDAVALAAFTYLVAAALLGWLARTVTGDAASVVGMLIAGGGAQLVGGGICLLIAADRFDGGVPRFFLGGSRVSAGAMLRVVIVVTVLAMGVCPLVLEASLQLVHYFAPEQELPTHPTIAALRGGGQPFGVVLALWVSAAVLSPVAEELFFRGLLQTVLVNTLRSRRLAVVIAAIVFASVHFSQPQAIPALIVLAVLIGYAYERTGSLLVPVLIHALFNLKTLVWEALGAFPT